MHSWWVLVTFLGWIVQWPSNALICNRMIYPLSAFWFQNNGSLVIFCYILGMNHHRPSNTLICNNILINCRQKCHPNNYHVLSWMSIVGSQLGRKLWYREDSVKTSYFLFSLQHLDKERAGDGGFCRLLSMLKLLEVATGIPDPFNARLFGFSSSTLVNRMISFANVRSRIIWFLRRHKIR